MEEKDFPLERVFTYRDILEAMNRQGKRMAATSATKLLKSRSKDDLAEKVGENHETIRRYVRLTYLIPELLEFVDRGKMAARQILRPHWGRS